ncbi:MAG: amidohydrolase [Woeseiaceae bacterium]
MRVVYASLFLIVSLFLSRPAWSDDSISARLLSAGDQLEDEVIQLRRHFHENPELSNREFETAKRIAEELRALGLNPTTGIASTGVVAIIEGGKPGPLVALRADIDALPVEEQTDVPFASKARGQYRGNDVGVMHACGHDTHIAMLLGAAKALVGVQDDLQGSVMLIFQPAEEGAPEGETGGAERMLAEGLFDEQKPEAIFGLHTFSSAPAGVIAYRSGPAMASSDRFTITVKGRQTHGSRPWGGVDPIVTASQIVMAVQTIASRQVDVTKAPSVISFGIIDGGVRNNIIPDEVELVGTIRNFDMGIRDQIHQKLKHTAETVALSAGATAEVNIDLGYPVTVNDPGLTARMLPTIRRVAGEQFVVEAPLVTGAEDFSYYALETPGLFLYLGGTPRDQDPLTAPSNHSPLFYVDESTLKVGVNVLTNLVADYFDQVAND